MLIIQISDTHIVTPNHKAFGIAETAENLRRCVHYINSLKPEPDIVLITGDISNSGQYEELVHAKHILDELNVSYYVVPGNHDNRDYLWSVFSNTACPSRNNGFINYVIDDFEVRFIALDSTRMGPGAEICNKRAIWLEQQLAKLPDKPTILFMHHPPVKCSVLETDKDGFIGADLFGDIVEKHANIKAVFCGHIHLSAHINWRNTVVSIAPSTQMRLRMDLTMKEESQFYLDDPAFQMHYWTADKNLVSYPVIVRDSGKPGLFAEKAM